MQQSLSPSNEPGAAALGGLKSYALRWEFCLAVLAEAAAALCRTREQRLLFLMCQSIACSSLQCRG